MMNFIIEYLESSLKLMVKISIYISAVMVLTEFLKNLKIIDWLNTKIYPFTKHLGISEGANFPLIIGYLIGVTYGSGMIYQSYKNGEMNKKDIYLVCTFIAIAHAIIEDTLLFSAFGANLIIIFGVRTLLAIVVTYFANKVFTKIKAVD